MFPTSSRVKLNRVALKDVVGLKLAPRRRRPPKPITNISAGSSKQGDNVVSESAPFNSNAPPQTCLTQLKKQEHGTEMPADIPGGKLEEKCAGSQQAKRKNDHVSRDDMECKHNRPNTRGKYQRSKLYTRSKGRLEQPEMLGNFRWRFTLCVGADSDSGGRAKLRVKNYKMSRRVKPASGTPPPPLTKTAEKRTQSAFKPGRRCGSVIGNDKTVIRRVSRVAKRSGGGGGRSSEKAKCGLCDPQPAAARTGRVTPSVLSRPPNNRNTHPNATGSAGSEGCLRRSSGASHCVVRGESKHVSSQQKNLCKQAPKSSRPGSETRTVDFKVNRENAVGGATDKIIVWINQYPKVTLCDVGKKCDACRHNCGYVLPDILKNKVVRCFKREMRAGFRFWPGCFGHDIHEREASARAKSNKCRPSVPDEEHTRPPQSLVEHLEEGMVSRAPSCQPTKRVRSCRTREDSATRFSSGRHAKKGECGTGVWGRDASEDTGRGSDSVGVEIRRDKRIKLGDSVVSSSTCGSAVKENCIAENPGAQRGCPAETNGLDVSSEPFCEEDEVGADEAESFTCQRVKAYIRKIRFSCARTYVSWPFLGGGPAPADTTASSAGSVHSSEKDSPSVKANLNEASSSSDQTENLLPGARLEAQIEDDESILGRRNGKRHRNASVNTDTGIIEQTAWSEESVSFSFHSRPGTEPGVDAALTSPFLVNGPETYSSMSTPSPSALGLSDWETGTTLSAVSDPSTKDGPSRLSATPPSLPPSSFLPRKACDLKLKTVENLLFHCKETRLISCGSLSSAQPNTDSSRSGGSSPLLPQDAHKNDEFLPERSPPELKPYYYTSPIKRDCSFTMEHYGLTDSSGFMLPPVLSPVTSPQMHSFRSSLSSQSSSTSEEEEEEMSADANKNKTVTECQMSRIVNRCTEKSMDYHEERGEVSMNFNTLTASDTKEPGDCNEEESREESDDEDDVEQGKRSLEQVPLNPKMKASLGSAVLTEAHSSPSSDEEDGEEGEQDSVGEAESRPSEISDILNEFIAYEQDILLVDVIQDDPELFDNLPEQSLLKLGPARAAEAPRRRLTAAVKTSTRIGGTPAELDRRLAPGRGDFHCDSPDNTEEGDSRPWRPRCNTTQAKTQSTCPGTNKQPRHVSQSDANNNHADGDLERSQPIHTDSPHIPHLMSAGTGPWIKNAASVTDLRRQKSNAPQQTSRTTFVNAKTRLELGRTQQGYCRQFFSESLSCGFKMCRFQHLPVKGDEKFCVETVARFTKNPACLQKAGAVFMGYYHKNPPGVYFSVPVLLSLLRALLKAGMVSDVFAVLSASLAHSIVPGHEFLLDLFNFVREKGLMGLVPELMQLTFKMANVGLELSLDCLDCVKNAPMFQQTVHPNSTVAVSANHKLSTAVHFPEYLNLAHAVVEIELCTKQEDWKRIGEVFRCICQSSHHPYQVERISGRIAIALLCESKDKLSLPFAAFAETVCQNEGEDNLIKSFVGRIGVSLMLRYHKTHQWVKGRRVVEIMSTSKVGYTTLKGLFGNEDGASRCYLVTVATELLLLSGSVEGALNTLRENKWFLSSSLWPCEPADLESRTHVLIRLAKKTSHRGTLEVLCNLPGIKEPNDSIDISRYSPLFNAHLQVCVDRLMLPVASDTVDLMLSKNLAVEHSVLQTLLHKLGKQNIWLRAREVFRRSLSVGYYPGVSAPPGDMALIVPCELGEVELALAFEMVITVNASIILPLPETTASSLSITLTRSQSCESEYLSAGSRLLSAACIPQPKLTVHYTAVNSSQEQVFRLDVSSARRWLRHNHLWAGEVWTH